MLAQVTKEQIKLKIEQILSSNYGINKNIEQVYLIDDPDGDFLMDVDDEFQITISNEEQINILTASDLVEAVFKKLIVKQQINNN